MISRIKSYFAPGGLTRLDKRRAELAMAWAQRHPLVAAFYNVCVYVFLGAIKSGVFIYTSTAKLLARARGGSVGTEALPKPPTSPFPARLFPHRPRVLLVGEATIPQCFLYRIQQKLDMFQSLGWEAAWLAWPDLERVKRDAHFYDVIIFYRVPGFPKVLAVIRYLASLNKLLIYDLDDLIFDRSELVKKFSNNLGQLPRKEYEALLTGADLYRAAMAEFPFCIVTTQSLSEQVLKSGVQRNFILPNGISPELLQIAQFHLPRSLTDEVTIFYGSGTKTHDADFAAISSVLAELLEHYPQLKLVIAGPVLTDGDLEPYKERISRVGLLDYKCFLELLACADINIAPLEAGVFADCKSEIKWLEAGLLGVPSIVSNTATYAQVAQNGIDIQIAGSPAEWRDKLVEMIENPALRKEIGSTAKKNIQKKYGLDVLASGLREIVEQCARDSVQQGKLEYRATNKTRLLLVNTLYLPQAMGGATRIVKNIVDGLTQDHPDEYEIFVFTCDLSSTNPYQVSEYVQDGVVVTAMSIPMRVDLEILYQDDNVKQLFREYLKFLDPDIVHFHSIQRLTASMLEVTEALDIPHLVTMHDSWWISDHPFMMDDNNELLPSNIAHPLVANASSLDLNATINRNQYLRERLQRCDARLAVSRYQRELYQTNGIECQLVENGVATPPGYHKAQRERLVLGYAGGLSVHKGYYFLKETISGLALENTELVIVDLFAKDRAVRTERWNNTPVEIHPKFDFAETSRFYSLLDVLIVPSLWPESFGLVAREAALLGLWVVVADSGGLPESVRPGETGFAFKAGDRDALGKVLLELDAHWQRYKKPVDPALLAKLKIRSVSQQAQETHEIYQRVLADKHPL